ncbi:MAG: hypothetical protein ABEJ30_04590 [Halorientalis sp.]
MKFRCTYCGKPQARNDPPCDNCGHSEFEKAVVPLAPEGDDDAATTHVWVCPECGNDHPKNTPPCDRCGSAPLERREQTYDEDAVLAEMRGEDGAGRGVDVSYLDVLDARLVLGFLGVSALVAVLGLGALGVVTIPGITPPGPVPGNATNVDGLSLSAVESAYVSGLNDRRSEAGLSELTVTEDLAAAATYVNRERVRADYARGEGPTREGVRSALGDACNGATPVARGFTVRTDLGSGETRYGTESALAGALLSAGDAAGAGAEATEGLVGVDVHVAPDGTVYVTRVVC